MNEWSTTLTALRERVEMSDPQVARVLAERGVFVERTTVMRWRKQQRQPRSKKSGLALVILKELAAMENDVLHASTLKHAPKRSIVRAA